MKPKIALIVDTDDWAFYNRATIIAELLKDDFYFKIIPARTALQDNIMQVILLIQGYDLVHFFWRGLLFSLSENDIVFKRNGIDVNDFIKDKFSNIVKTTCIVDHLLLDEENINKSKEILNFVDNYYVMSNKLYDIYNNLEIKPPHSVIRGGVRLDLFQPEDLERFSNIENRTIRIGWSGNSNWGKWQDSKQDNKGVYSILIPTIDKLKQEGYNIELKLADKNKETIPIEKMKDFYNSIDMYICVSETEGGPNPILEAMACGVPIISTDVGFVKDVFGEKEKEYILSERSKESLENTIKKLINNPKQFKDLSEENLEEINKYSYENIAQEFKKFFNDSLLKKVGM